ncbi:exodeoxyribonuclease VIII [Escherichia sp. E4742]|uniref:exodeoxyribonuclease VIII n=1 Tax=Escherichia sp. E4742 TaxID=2044467 RepID=UPI0010806B48|nr:exodeoxyribonuclease VIII [Escherichia sp. E4742]QCT89624.1 exodeoxyribonuclease VIII [Escherichia sp. E4742]TGB58953.1 exonuclease VIII [Escherichia sp. E4742]TLJ08855.1 exodeoxyribonuclease VIII [Escherichia sp. E4742]
MSTKPLFLLRKAKKSSGEPDVVLWASDDFESTCATLDYLLVKSGKKLSSYFKPVATNFPVVNDLPPEGEIDFTWSERYQLSKDSMTWELKPGAAPDDVHHQENTRETEELAGNQEENAQADAHGDCQDCEIPVATLSLTHRFLHLFFFGRMEDGKYSNHATPEQRNNVIRMEMDTENSYLQSLLTAVRSHPELDKLANHHLGRLAESVSRVFTRTETRRISPAEFDKFISTWMKTDYLDQGLLTKELAKGNCVSEINRTPSGANAGGGILTDRGEGFVHDDASLARDVATGVLARSMDVDIYNLHPAHAKRIEEIIAENKPPFSVFRDKFITMPGGLDYSRAIVVASVKEAPIGIEAISHHVTEYLNRVLTETDHANPDPEIVDIACGRSSAPMPQRVTEEGKQDDDEKPQPSGTTADEQGEAETMEPDATEHHQDTQPLDAQSQVNSVDAKYQELRAELHEARKNIPSKNPVDADKLLAASRGEFVDGISDPNDPKWVKGIQTRDSVYQNQPETKQNTPETEKTSPDVKQPEPVVQQEPEKVCNACGKTGGDNCPDCGVVMGDATYQETFDEANQVEAKENDPEEMEGAEHTHNENAGSDPHRDCSDETGEVADPVIAGDIEPGIYYGISNENYHAGPGVSKSQLDDIADTPALYLWRKNAPVDTTKTKTLDLGTAFHCRVLEPEEFSNRFIVAPEFNRRTNAGKEEEKAFLMECASTGKTVINAEEGRKIELMYQSVMALPLGQWLVESAGHAESSIYWEDPETGILCRCRPDKIIPEFHWIMDVKTTADIQRFKTAYYDYRYHVQDAFYSDGYEVQFGVQPTFVFLVASTTIECGRYPVEIFMMGEEAKLAGQLEYHRNLRTLADCLNTDEWPAIKTLSLPRWAKEYAND